MTSSRKWVRVTMSASAVTWALSWCPFQSWRPWSFSVSSRPPVLATGASGWCPAHILWFTGGAGLFSWNTLFTPPSSLLFKIFFVYRLLPPSLPLLIQHCCFPSRSSIFNLSYFRAAYLQATFASHSFFSFVILPISVLCPVFHASPLWPPPRSSTPLFCGFSATIQQTSQNLLKVSEFDVLIRLQLQWSALRLLNNVMCTAVCVSLCVCKADSRVIFSH